ncbi:MAG: GNAT family protein [Lachnospiraceae bacterium]|nr:GNAT family protein [Lachnospiraceae bacterium]
MYLRKLKVKDAVPMLEWMHDEDVVKNLAADFMNMTLESCMKFIETANADESITLHRAICTDEDKYLGTISLKNISGKDSNAEYAIVICSEAMGKGVSKFATEEILKIAFNDLGLHKVYLYVKEQNIRARKFYDKVGFRTEGIFREHAKNKNGMYDDIVWMAVLDREFIK